MLMVMVNDNNTTDDFTFILFFRPDALRSAADQRRVVGGATKVADWESGKMWVQIMAEFN